MSQERFRNEPARERIAPLYLYFPVAFNGKVVKWLLSVFRRSPPPPFSFVPSFSRPRCCCWLFSPLLLFSFFFFLRVSRERRKQRGGGASVEEERKSCGEGRSFVCGPRGVLGQLGAEVSRCVWYATVSCAAPSHVNRHKRRAVLCIPLITRGMACKRSHNRPPMVRVVLSTSLFYRSNSAREKGIVAVFILTRTRFAFEILRHCYRWAATMDWE